MGYESNTAELWEELHSEGIAPLGTWKAKSPVYCMELLREREQFFGNPELYLELAMQDVQYEYATPEYYLVVVSTWVNLAPARLNIRKATFDIAEAFARRNLSRLGRIFANSLRQVSVGEYEGLASSRAS